mmetsp:Transcript_3064/g.7040  ORF Transcript_3064/g.7040 Transcript_3064/m.7040 type:complete len:141 (-) Transcript_3064:134-556(-)
MRGVRVHARMLHVPLSRDKKTKHTHTHTQMLCVLQSKKRRALEGEERRLRKQLEALERDVRRLTGIKDDELDKRKKQRMKTQAAGDKAIQKAIGQQIHDALEAQAEDEGDQSEEGAPSPSSEGASSPPMAPVSVVRELRK